MTSVNELRQQLEVKYLEPVKEETPTVPLVEDITATQTTFRIVANVLSPDDESYIAPGRLLEVDYELVRVLSYDASLNQITCTRGVRGSTAAAHESATAEVRFPTRWPRWTIKGELETAIGALWQPLFAVNDTVTPYSFSEYVQLPLNTVRILQVKYQSPTSMRWMDCGYQLLPTHPLDNNYAGIQLTSIPYGRVLVSIVYGTEIEAPASVTDDITGLPSSWERIVLADAAAALLAGVDIDAATQEYLTQQIRLEGFPVRSGSTISQNLIRFREYLVDEAKKDIEARYPRGISHTEVSLFS